jgi:hypothetical protein
VPNRRRLLGIAACLTALVSAPARAEETLPAGVPDLIGARGLALGAYRGIAAGNDGIFTNAASLAARRRYSIESSWLLDRVSSDTAFQVLGASVVDSETTSVTGGFSYTRVMSGPWIGNLFHVPLAFPVTDRLFMGVTGKYLSLGGPAGDSIRAVNFDASAYWQSSSGLGFGVAGYNLLPAGHLQVQPRAVGVGASYGDDRRYHVTVDWRGDTQRQGKLTSLLAVGGELLLGDLVPVRASYIKDDTRNGSFWSAGLGLVSSSGLALDLAYRQGIDNSSERTFGAAIKFFLVSH